MRRTFTVLVTFLLLVIPARLFAKGELVKITIKGAGLSTPIDITDFTPFRNLTVWAGPGTVSAGPGVDVNGKQQTEGFIVDWPQAIAQLPSGLQHYEVFFYAKLNEVSLVYVVYYDCDPSSKQGYIYLPGKGDPWFSLNTGTIFRGKGFEGHWFHATREWDTVAKSLIAGAKVTASSTGPDHYSQ
jgi:hypothetical protein